MKGQQKGQKKGWMPDDEWYAMKAQQQQQKSGWADKGWSGMPDGDAGKSKGGGGKGKNWIPDDVFYAMKAMKQQMGGAGVWKQQFQKQGKGGGQGRSGLGPHRTEPKKLAWVGNLPPDANKEELLELGMTAGAKWAEVYHGKTAVTGVLGFDTA